MGEIPEFNPKWKAKQFNSKSDRQRAKGSHLGWKWWNLRKQYLMYFPYCAKCKLLGTEIHHIQPRSTHPQLTYDWRNLMTLCSQCHKNIHNMGNGDAEHIP